jgi:hypothetical protein
VVMLAVVVQVVGFYADHFKLFQAQSILSL